MLCRDKIFQFGDAIAIVAAETEEQARAAAEAVKVDIEELPTYMNAIDAMAPDAIEIHPGTPNVFFETNCHKGWGFRLGQHTRFAAGGDRELLLPPAAPAP